MGFFDIFKSKGNEFTDADKAKLNSIDLSKFVDAEEFNKIKEELEKTKSELEQFKSIFSESDSMPKSQFESVIANYALKKDIPSVSGLASKGDIPKPLDLSGYMLKTDTVKYIENSNTTSKIKRFTLSIEDKATFDPKKNPNDNIAHSV